MEAGLEDSFAHNVTSIVSSCNETHKILSIKSRLYTWVIPSLMTKTRVEISTLKKSKNTNEKIRCVVNLEVSRTITVYAEFKKLTNIDRITRIFSITYC